MTRDEAQPSRSSPERTDPERTDAWRVLALEAARPGVESGVALTGPWRREGAPSVLSLGDGTLTARIDWYRLRLPLRGIRAAAIGPLRRSSAAAPFATIITEDELRGALQALLWHQPRPQIIAFSVATEEEEQVDLLWRVGIRAGARCHIADHGEMRVVRLQFPGVKAAFAVFLSAFPGRSIAARLRGVLRTGEINGSKRRAGSNRSVIFALDTGLAVSAVQAPAGLEFVEVAAEEIARRPARYGVPLTHSRLPGGEQCFAGLLNGEFVYRMWATVDDVTVGRQLPSSIRDTVGRPAMLVSSAFTVVEHRGKAIWPAALTWIAARARAQGVRNLVCFVNIENTPSLRGVTKAGFTKIGEMVRG